MPLALSASAVSSRPVENTPNQPRNKITRESAWAGPQQRSMITAINPVCDLTCFRPYRMRVLVSFHNVATLLVRMTLSALLPFCISHASADPVTPSSPSHSLPRSRFPAILTFGWPGPQVGGSSSSNDKLCATRSHHFTRDFPYPSLSLA